MEVLDLFHHYRDDVYRLAMSYIGNPQEAEDICQTVFMKLLEQGALSPGKEKAWLMQVTANQCRSLLRSAWWRHTVALEETIPAPASGTDDTLQAVMKLPHKYRVVIYLRYYEKYTAVEIGKLLKIPASTVTTRLARGRQQLKSLLKED